jgi:hypothetical protein
VRATASIAKIIALGCSCLCVNACSSRPGEVVDDPYLGAAFPDRRPRLSLPRADFGLTSNNGSDSTTVLDLSQFEVLGAGQVGVDPIALDGPHHVAVSRELNAAFFALSYPAPAVAPGPHAAHGSSQRPGSVQQLALADLAPVASISLETNPGDIVLSEDATRLVVSHFDLLRATHSGDIERQRADLALLDPRALDASPRFIRTCVAPHGVALSRPRGELAFVACYGEDAIAVVDLDHPSAAPELIGIAEGGTPGQPQYGPYAAMLSNQGDRVAVSDTESSDVRIFDVASRAFEKIVIVTPGKPYFAAWAEADQLLYVPTQNPDTVLVVDPSDASVEHTRAFAKDECQLPHEVVFGSDRSTLFVVCEGDHQQPSVVLALDRDSLETKATLPVGVYPDRLAIAREAR